VVVIGIGVDQMLGFSAAGARLAGAISVVPAGSPPPTVATLPVLSLTARTRDVLVVAVCGFAQTLADHHQEVVTFLDSVDPDRAAVIAGYLPVPRTILEGRRAWVADAAVASRLEDKAGARDALSQAVPVVASERLPSRPDQRWWSDTCARWGTDRLVVQAAGLSGGGSGTTVCDSVSELPTLNGGQVMPFVDGVTANVTGVIDCTGHVAAFPASRQLIRLENGRPLYAGNVTGEPWATDQRPAIGAEVRAIGAELAARGYVGPFGADFILTADGRRLYHDLNPRINGVVDNMAYLLDRPGQVPLVPLLLSEPDWADDEQMEFEQSLHAAAAARPLARLWLTRTARQRALIAVVPPSGAWEIDPSGPTGRYLGGAALGGTTAILHTTLAPGQTVEAGDRLVLGNLYCEPALAARLANETIPDLVDALLA